MADWKIEIIGEERDRTVSVREDVRRYGPIVLAFLLGILTAIVFHARIPLP